MTLSDLGSLGEFLGAIAVVFSLIYLALQVRQNTNAMRASTYLGLTDGWQNFLMGLEERDFELMSKAIQEPSSVTETELLRIYYRVRVTLRRYENDYFQYRSGNFDPAAWEGYWRSIQQDTLANPLIVAMWKLQRTHFDENFSRVMDQAVPEVRADIDPPFSKTLFLEAVEQATQA